MKAIETLRNVEQAGLYPKFKTISSGVNEPVCVIDDKKYLMFCSNNYLGMTENKKVKESAINAIKKFGVGPGGSRVISGNVSIIEELERRIANLVGTEDSLTFPTGYMANVGVFSGVLDNIFGDIFGKQEHDSVIFSDEYNHGSIVDGCRLSTAKKVIFKHDNINDLREKIEQNPSENKMIVTEGVFSLEGEIIDLPNYVALAKETKSILMIDDAHGVGILGKRGGGVGDKYNLSKDVDILMGCMDKAMGGTGGYLAGKKELIKFLRISTRPSLLSSAITTEMAGAMIESINQIEENSNLRDKLFEKAKYVRDSLLNAGLTILGRDLLPAIPLYVGEDTLGVEFERMLLEKGIYCPVVRSPAVPYGHSRFRIIIMVTHTKEQLDQFVNTTVEIAKKIGILK